MQIEAHPRFRQLLSELRRSANQTVQPRDLRVYRCVELKWARPAYLISGEGTRQKGSRWMRPGCQRVVHAASTASIALKESRRAFRTFGVGKPRQNPRVSIEINAILTKVVDLETLTGIFDWLQIDELLGENWEKANQRGFETLSQACGRAICELGLEGLITPSAEDRRGRNLVWFPTNLEPGSHLEISGQTELERWLAI